MSRLFVPIAFIVILFLANSVTSFSSVTLASKGKPSSVIIIANNPSDAARQGAADLQMWIQRASGADLAILKESDLGKESKNSLILVGDSKMTRDLGIDPGSFAPEEFMIKTFPGKLVIMGSDLRQDGVKLNGTILAVDTFAEKFLDVRVLWPGELGEVVPEKKTIVIGDMNVRQKPLLHMRRIRNVGIILPSVKEKIESLGMKCDSYPAFHKESNTWFRFHRLYGSFEGALPHAFTQYWKRFSKDHPEWFALQPDGTRNDGGMDKKYQLDFQPGDLAQLCVSNQELVRQVAADCIETFRKNPTLDVFSISQNDDGSGTPSFCLCPKCEAMDAPDGVKTTISTLDGRMEHVSLTDRFVKFFSSVAVLVEKQMPDRYVGALSYSSYILPPVHAKLHPHVIVGLVPGPAVYFNDSDREEMRDSWLKWSEASSRLFLRPNFLMALQNFPAVYVHKLGQDMRFFADHKLEFCDFDCCSHFWSTNGLNYYVLAKLIWDPYSDVDSIVDDFCRAGFGPSSENIRGYYQELESITNGMAGERKGITPEMIARYYNDAALKELNAILNQADNNAKGDRNILGRIEFLRKGLEYAPISRDYLLASELRKKVDRDSSIKFETAKEKRDKWFTDQGFSWVLSVPWAIAYDY